MNFSDSCTDWCFYRLFSDCDDLLTAPQLPAITLAYECYGSMFYNCSKLSTAPQLPAITLAEECYFCIFAECTSLTSAPELPATELAPNCYASMFWGCVSLLDGPQLPATTFDTAGNCYSNLFHGCDNLSSINVSFSSWSWTDTSYWVWGVASTGIFYKPSSLPEEYGVHYIPSGWTVVNKDD